MTSTVASAGPSRYATSSTDSVSARVYPAMIPVSHPLASVRDAYNAVFVESKAAGELMFYGRGAGGAPTAGAVLGDLVSAARNRLKGVPGVGESSYTQRAVRPMGDALTRYHVSLDVADKAGVLAAVDVPAFRPLAYACRPEEFAATGRRAAARSWRKSREAAKLRSSRLE